jgi:hypothetical protein
MPSGSPGAGAVVASGASAVGVTTGAVTIGTGVVPIDARAAPTSGTGSTADGRGLARKSVERKLRFGPAVGVDVGVIGVVVASGVMVASAAETVAVAGAGAIASGVGLVPGTEDVGDAAAGWGDKLSLSNSA